MVGMLALAAGAIGLFRWQPIAVWPHPPLTAEKLNIATTTYLGSALVQVAAAKNYFREEGLEVALQIHTSGRSALDAVIDGKADLATVGDTPVMFAIARKVPLVVVATLARAERSHAIIARHDRGISTPADLKGKTVGGLPGTDSHFVLNMILASNGIAPDVVTLQDTRSENLAAALADGKVDAVSTWEPWVSAAHQVLGANSVAFYPESGFGFGFHLAGRGEFVRAHPAGMQKLLRALLRAEQFLNDQPQAARVLLIEATKAEPAVFDSTRPNFSLQLTLDQRLLTMLEDQARWASAGGLIDAAAAPNFLDALYLDAMLAVKPQAVSVVR